MRHVRQRSCRWKDGSGFVCAGPPKTTNIVIAKLWKKLLSPTQSPPFCLWPLLAAAKQVEIPNSVTIEFDAFNRCSSVTSIGGSAFYGCSSLRQVKMPALFLALGPMPSLTALMRWQYFGPIGCGSRKSCGFRMVAIAKTLVFACLRVARLSALSGLTPTKLHGDPILVITNNIISKPWLVRTIFFTWPNDQWSSWGRDAKGDQRKCGGPRSGCRVYIASMRHWTFI